MALPSSFETLHAEWKRDCEIDDSRLDQASMSIPSLHSKYLYLLDLTKDSLREQEYLYAVLLKKRTSWYDGNMSRSEMDELGWDYDPYDGRLIKTKSQRDHYLKTDEVLLRAQMEIDRTKQKVDAIKDMLDNVKWRHQVIKNAIDFKKFQAGF